MLDRPPNSPRASAKPSCNSPRRVRKRRNNCDGYSEKQVDRASGKAFALPGYGGLRRSGRTAVQDSLRLKKRLLFFFRARKLSLYQHSTTAHRSFLKHASICSPTQFAHLHGKPHRFLYRSDRLHGSSNGYASMGTDLLFTFISTAEHQRVKGDQICLYARPHMRDIFAAELRLNSAIFFSGTRSRSISERAC